ncbi:MAG: hypothetical protein ACD_3C00067G0003 [uncultured bacterium (gcode 4)]|uniref:Transposase IS200-like domain-containing protein n=1 Tax=uncultured bacterium (gcode 4) TaxID=1234023 RepID=K2GDL1_9BACT|nr:MAG: hypothetical protein ACD_3C00067G0003 [uncultured bacterium (gcode 4)]
MEIPEHFEFVRLDEFVIMNDHIHGIIQIDKPVNDNMYNIMNNVETRQCLVSTVGADDTVNAVNTKPYWFQNPWKWTLWTIIWSFKSVCTKNINRIPKKCNFSWQPNYHERIIRNEDEYLKIKQYIAENPLKQHYWNE